MLLYKTKTSPTATFGTMATATVLCASIAYHRRYLIQHMTSYCTSRNNDLGLSIRARYFTLDHPILNCALPISVHPSMPFMTARRGRMPVMTRRNKHVGTSSSFFKSSYNIFLWILIAYWTLAVSIARPVCATVTYEEEQKRHGSVFWLSHSYMVGWQRLVCPLCWSCEQLLSANYSWSVRLNIMPNRQKKWFSVSIAF